MKATLGDAVVLTDGCDFFTNEALEVGRVEYVDERGVAGVLLARRAPGGSWKPTWVGSKGEAVQVPGLLVLAGDVLLALSKAPRVPIREWRA